MHAHSKQLQLLSRFHVHTGEEITGYNIAGYIIAGHKMSVSCVHMNHVSTHDQQATSPPFNMRQLEHIAVWLAASYLACC